MSDPSRIKVTVSVAVIQLAQTAVRNDQPEQLAGYLKIMPLNGLKNAELDSLMGRFLSIGASLDRPACVKVVLEAWEQTNPVPSEMPLFVTLFLNPAIDVDVLTYCSRVLEDFTFLEVMDDLIRYDNAPIVPLACKRVIQVYGEQPLDSYKILLQLATDKNHQVANFLLPLIRVREEFAPIPKWVQNFFQREDLPLASQVVIPVDQSPQFRLPPIEEMVNLLTEGLQNNGISVDDVEAAKRTLRARLSIATTGERIKLLRPILSLRVLEDLQDDVELFRVLGPANPLVEASLEEMEHGGCRMFTCMVFDRDPETDFINDWFEGYCWQCNKRIRRRWHAVRQPRPHGGWIGAYCSWKCVRESIDEYDAPDILTHMMVDVFEVQINIIGIQDRLPDPKVEDKEGPDEGPFSESRLHPKPGSETFLAPVQTLTPAPIVSIESGGLLTIDLPLSVPKSIIIPTPTMISLPSRPALQSPPLSPIPTDRTTSPSTGPGQGSYDPGKVVIS